MSSNNKFISQFEKIKEHYISGTIRLIYAEKVLILQEVMYSSIQNSVIDRAKYKV